MDSKRKNMNIALNKFVIPKLRDIGYKGSLPHFRNILDNEIHLITFQFDRDGGGFVIEVSKTRNDILKTYWGKEIEPKKITAHDLGTRTRIHPKGLLENSNTSDWFRYDKLSINDDIYEDVCSQVISNINLIKNVLDEMPIYSV